MKYYPGFTQLFDNFFNDTFTSQNNVLKTDIKEKDGMYELNIEVAGFKKEDIQIELNQGYLTITATRKHEKEENEKYVRKERYVGTCSRSFYVGDNYKQEDIKASFDNGELKITLPTETQKIEETKQVISID